MTSVSASPGLRLARMHFPITALGYGRRIAIWVQGCSIGCRGCMSLDTWRSEGALMPVSSVIAEIEPWLPEADGISVTGGEPLEQAGALAELLEAARPKLSGDILLFTGYDADKLPQGAEQVLKSVDTLVAGPFDSNLPDTRPLSGSSNQTIQFLTPLGRDRYHRFAAAAGARPPIDLVTADYGLLLAGIPRAGDLERLGQHLSGSGISLKTSAGRLGRVG